MLLLPSVLLICHPVTLASTGDCCHQQEMAEKCHAAIAEVHVERGSKKGTGDQ